MHDRAPRPLSRAALIGLAMISLASCFRGAEASIKPPANPLLSGGLGWAVVKEAYVRLKEGPSDSAKDVDHLRRGSVYRLDSRVIGAADQGQAGGQASPVLWYGLKAEGGDGFAKGSELDVYESRAQAERAAQAYR